MIRQIRLARLNPICQKQRDDLDLIAEAQIPAPLPKTPRYPRLHGELSAELQFTEDVAPEGGEESQ